MTQIASYILIILTVSTMVVSVRYVVSNLKHIRFGSPGSLILGIALLNFLPGAIGVASGAITRTTIMYGEVLYQKASWISSMERYAIVATGLFSFCTIIWLISHKKKILISFVTAAVLAIVALSIFASFYSGYPLYAVRSLAWIISLAAVLLSVTDTNEGRQSLVVGAAISTIGITVLSGLLYAIDQQSAIRTCRFDKCGALGNLYQGIYANENALALVVVAGLPFLLMVASQKPVMMIAAAQAAFSVLIAGSRTGQIALAACLFSYVVWRGLPIRANSMSIRVVILQTVCVVGLLAQLIVPFFASRGSLTNRPELWRYVVEEANRSPIVGRGWNALEQLFIESGGLRDVSAYSAHNQLLDIYLVSGGIGVFIFAALILTTIFKYARVDSTLLLVLASSLWLGFLERPWNMGYLDWLSWSALACIGLIAQASMPSSEAIPHPSQNGGATQCQRKEKLSVPYSN